MRGYRPAEKALAWYLSSIAGFIDAVGFLFLGGYFLSYMSGNTTHFATSAAEGRWSAVVDVGGVMLLFLVGVMVGALINRLGVRHLAHGRARELGLMFVALATVISSVFVAMDEGVLAMHALSLAVGAMNCVFERDGEVSISLTYTTGTLVKMAQRFIDSFFGGEPRLWIAYALLWLSIAAGSVVGAACYMHLGVRAVWIICALVITGVAAAIFNRQRRRQLGLPL